MYLTMAERNYHAYMHIALSDYVDEWIAILENKIIAHGPDPKKVFDEAEHVAKGKLFLITRVPSSSAVELL